VYPRKESATVLETEPVIVDPEKPQKFSVNQKGTVEFRDVAFRYPGAEDDVLKTLSALWRNPAKPPLLSAVRAAG